MDDDLKKYYSERFSMFGSQGWKDLMGEVSKMIEYTNSLDSIDNEHSIDFRKGELSIMRWLLNLDELSRIVFNQLKDKE